MSNEHHPVCWRDRDLSIPDAIMYYRGQLHIDSVRGSAYLSDLKDTPLLEDVLRSGHYEVEIKVICRISTEKS